MSTADAAPALKDIFDERRYRSIAGHLDDLLPRFDRKAFLEQALLGHRDLSLMQRLRRTTECLHAVLPKDFGKATRVLRKLAPRLDHGFVGIVLSDYVALYGQEHFDEAMDALAFFTKFGSSEFAVREFLRRDLKRSLAVMRGWALHEDEHVRRLASEGCRPRLPWSFRLEALIQDPEPAFSILERLQADPSLYVRKSVANHLNDITKDHPDWVMDRLGSWSLENSHTAWIVKRGLRTLIKAGNTRALGIIGAGERAEVTVNSFSISPRSVSLGNAIAIDFALASAVSRPQRLVIDYAVYYVKKSGAATRKVFKLKELTLAPETKLRLIRRQTIRDFTTRIHYPGVHRVELLINGEVKAEGEFVLRA